MPASSQSRPFLSMSPRNVVPNGELLHFDFKHELHTSQPCVQANYSNHPELSLPNQTVHLGPAGEPWVPENIPLLSDTQDAWQTNQIDGPRVPSSVHAAHLWHGNYMTPPHSSYDLGRNGTYLDSHAELNPSNTPVLIRYPILNGQPTSVREPCDHGRTGTIRPFSGSPGLLDRQYDVNPLIFHNLPHWPFSPSVPDWVTHPSPATNLTSSYLLPFPIHHLLHQDSTTRSRRKRQARAIEYNGLWIDKEELLQGVMEPGGKITVFQCRWEEGHSPCHLWVKGDKSCINAHIQKWHGGEPGGVKLETDCRWSGCGETMLKESISRHVVSVHLGELWECQGCRKRISRKDTYVQHLAKSAFAACRNSGAVITYVADAREIDVRAALNGGGTLRHAGGA